MPGQRPEIRSLETQDIDAAVALTESVGWGERRVHWRHFLDWAGPGALGLFLHGTLVSAGCVFCYGNDLAWLGCIATHRDQQRRGFGTRLCEALLEVAQARGIDRIMLDAGAMGRPLYERLGFRALANLERWRGEARPSAGPAAPGFEKRDLQAVIRLDASQFGARRARIIHDLVSDEAVTSWVVRRQGRVAGFAALKAWLPDGPAHFGPWQAERGEDAAALMRAALAAWEGRRLYLDIPAANSTAKEIAAGCGLHAHGAATRMIFADADPLPADGERQFGIAMRATG